MHVKRIEVYVDDREGKEEDADYRYVAQFVSRFSPLLVGFTYHAAPGLGRQAETGVYRAVESMLFRLGITYGEIHVYDGTNGEYLTEDYEEEDGS